MADDKPAPVASEMRPLADCFLCHGTGEVRRISGGGPGRYGCRTWTERCPNCFLVRAEVAVRGEFRGPVDRWIEEYGRRLGEVKP